MNRSNFLNRIYLGIKDKPLQLLTTIIIAYGFIWSLLEPLIAFVPSVAQYFSGQPKFFTLLLISILIGLYRSAIPVEIKIKYGNSSIKVIFGDLFSFNGFKVIPVSKFFLETQVVETSLQNKIIQMFIQSRAGNQGFELYLQKLRTALQGKNYQEHFRDATGQNEKYYPLGTTAILELNGQEYMLFALTQTELRGYIPKDNCDVSQMWLSLGKFWYQARIDARGKPINIPLIGSGVTGIRLSPNRILELNLLAIANAIEEVGKITTEEIRIILHPKYMEDINLSDFENIWS